MQEKRLLKVFGGAALLGLGVACGLGPSDSVDDPAIPAPPRPGEERCDPHETLFQLVAGPTFVGAVIPGSYFANVRGNEDLFARRFGWRAFEAWTPTQSDIERAETGIRAALAAASANPMTIDPTASGQPARARLDREILSKILPDLPCYRRQYAGLILGGRRQLLCRFFLPDELCFRRWQCDYVSGVDFEHQLWFIRYDFESGTYEGFDFGS